MFAARALVPEPGGGPRLTLEPRQRLVERGVGRRREELVERRLRVMDLVIKYLTVRMDDAMKRLDKIKAHRQKRPAKLSRSLCAGSYW